MKRVFIIIFSIVIIITLLIGMLIVTRFPYDSRQYMNESMDRLIDQYHVPGVTAGVIRSGEVLFESSRGVRVQGQDNRIEVGDYYHIGSCAKAVLACIAARMVTEELIDWDTQFFEVFPDLIIDAREAYKHITLENLISCRAGIKPYTSGSERYPDLSDSNDVRQDFFRYLLQLEPSSNINTDGTFAFEYSNAGYALAAAMLEEVSGQNYEALIDNFFTEHTGIEVHFAWPYDIDNHQPYGHMMHLNDELIRVGPNANYDLNELIWVSGHMSVTGYDFAQFCLLFLQGLNGDSTYLDKETFEYLCFGFDEFSLGIWNGSILEHRYAAIEGTAGTFYARGVFFPDEDIAFSILMNAASEPATDYLSMRMVKAYLNKGWMFWV